MEFYGHGVRGCLQLLGVYRAFLKAFTAYIKHMCIKSEKSR